jgi:predicted house-cleaning noncanonical NTP pyrophosphatase (MazG superfamily)
MNSMENSLNKIAETILHFDEASLAFLWEKYKNKVENFSNTKEWEKAVIIFYIINSVITKNAIFNEKMLEANEKSNPDTSSKKPKAKHYLKLVK